VLAEGIATREGILEYKTRTGVRRELVTREAVLDTARTLPRSAVTLEHPKSGFVTTESVKTDGVGDVDGEATVEEDNQGAFVRVKVALRRADAIDAFDKGADEVSCGYAVQLDETPGTHPLFGAYDARQIGRRCNHLALVERGRGGPTVSLRADSADAAGQYVTPKPPPKEKLMNPKLAALLTALGVERLDDEGHALETGIARAKTLRADADDKAEADSEAEKAKTDADAKAAELEQMKADKDACQAKLDELQGKYDAMKAKMDEMMEAEKGRKDAAELSRLQAIAAKVNVDHKDVALDDLRIAIAKTRVDSVTADSGLGYLEGIIATIEKDSSRSDSRYDGFRSGSDDHTRGDGADKPVSDPWLASNRQEA